MAKGVLVLADGTVMEGEGFGAQKDAKGEVVFNTCMAGYQEYLTDPSYKYQILMPTYPMIGNYGVTPERFESDKIQVEGFIVRELCEKPSHGQMINRLDKWMEEEGIPGLKGVDTRFLTRKIRDAGVMNGILKIPYVSDELEELKEEAMGMKSISDVDLVELVTIPEPVAHEPSSGEVKRTVVLIDCGAKMSIVKCLVSRGCRVIRVPSGTSAKEMLNFDPDGVMLSNGPGDPERAGHIVKSIKGVIDEQLPVFGVCFGNQLVGRAFGGKTYKLKFGHRGSNQPVKSLKTGKVHVTAQNHGFAVDADSLPSDVVVTEVNLNDGSVEGLRHRSLPVHTVQYHPEARAGPWDTECLFDEFVGTMDREKAGKK